MKSSAPTTELAMPRLASLRVPSDPSLAGIIGNAHVLWRLAKRKKVEDAPSGDAIEEYRSVCEFMRLYATLRFYQLALLLGTSGTIVTGLSSTAVRQGFARIELLRAGGLIVSLAFLVMEFRASSYWHRLRDRGNALARRLRFEPFPASSRWNPLTTSGASFYLHALLVLLWLGSVLLRFQADF